MCASSMVGDFYGDKWRQTPALHPFLYPSALSDPHIGRAEFEALKREVADMKELLKRAIDYDRRTGQADCEVDDKMDLLRRVAMLVGVNIDDVIGGQK
jgi:hypothetical protein